MTGPDVGAPRHGSAADTGLEHAARELVAAVEALDDVARTLGVDPREPGRWVGRGADVDAARRADLAGAARDLAAGGRTLADAVAHTADRLTAVSAWSSPWSSPSSSPGPGPLVVGPLLPAVPVVPVGPVVHGMLETVADAVVDRRISEIDADLAAVVDGTSPVPGARPGGPRGPDPSTVASWWAGLDDGERDRLAAERPALVGGLDGLPAAVRDVANRRVLAAERHEAQSALDAPLPADGRAIGGLLGRGRTRTAVRDRLDRLVALEAALDAPGRRLLALETGGEAGPGAVRAAVALGDVDTAAHVGVFTPGFTADVRDLPAWAGELEEVRAAAGPRAATVAWYGYDAPQWPGVARREHSVLTAEPAREGGARLARFLDGLGAARPRPAHVTAVGHSYGSLTTAQALGPPGPDGVSRADDVVYLGSPGVGAATGAPQGRAWVVEAGGDPVADAGWFGPDPNRMPGTTGLSAREVVLPDGRVLAASEGHGDYLRAGTTSSHNVAAVIGGRPQDVVLDRGVGAGDRLRGLVERRPDGPHR